MTLGKNVEPPSAAITGTNVADVVGDPAPPESVIEGAELNPEPGLVMLAPVTTPCTCAPATAPVPPPPEMLTVGGDAEE